MRRVRVDSRPVFKQRLDLGARDADLRRKVLSHHKEMGMEDAFVYAPEDGEYYETAEYEMDSPHMRLIERYDEVLSGRRWRPNWRIAILRPRRP